MECPHLSGLVCRASAKLTSCTAPASVETQLLESGFFDPDFTKRQAAQGDRYEAVYALSLAHGLQPRTTMELLGHSQISLTKCPREDSNLRHEV